MKSAADRKQTQPILSPIRKTHAKTSNSECEICRRCTYIDSFANNRSTRGRTAFGLNTEHDRRHTGVSSGISNDTKFGKPAGFSSKLLLAFHMTSRRFVSDRLASINTDKNFRSDGG